MDTYTIESKDEKFSIENSETFEYEKTKKRESLSINDLYKVLTDIRNRSLSGDFKITNSNQEETPFEIVEIDKKNSNLIIKNGNKTEIFDSSTLNTAVITVSNDSKTTEIFASNGKELSKEIINDGGKSREYTEFHKFGNVKLKMQIDNNGKQSYTLERYDKNNNLIETTKPFLEDGDDFETVKNNNTLGHKRKFHLSNRCRNEKYFRDFGINTVMYGMFAFDELENDIVTDEEIEEAVNKLTEKNNNIGLREILIFQNALIMAKQIEFLKKNSKTLKKLGEELSDKGKRSIYSVEVGEEKRTFKVKEEKEFDDGDKLKVKVYEDGKLGFECDNISIEPGKKYCFTVPYKDKSAYLFDESTGKHHSNFPWDKEKNPNFSVVAGGCVTFKVSDDGTFVIDEIGNDNGHFMPTAKDSAESLLRISAKNALSVLKERGYDIKDRSVGELLNKDREIIGKGYNISKDVTKDGSGTRNCASNVNQEISESEGIISKRRLDLIDRNARSSIMSRSV